MNLSGRAVSKAYSKVGAEKWGQLCVIYDDLELPVGQVKLREVGMGK
jgi:peptidyl-tRNA hydrolase